MAGRDDSNIFDFYSNLVHQEQTSSDPESSAQLDSFPEWNSFDRFCKSLAHSVFQNLGPEGKEDFLDRIHKCRTHEEIIRVADEESVINITIDMLLQEANDRNVEVKDASQAKRLREEGNGLYKRKDYAKSLNLYSKAISLAPDHDVEFVLSLANRSATFLHLFQFADSLKDIDIVIEKGTYPDDRLYIVYGRKIQCLKALGREEEASSVYQSSISHIESLIQDASLLEMNKDALKTSLEKKIPDGKTDQQPYMSPSARRRVKTALDEGDVNPNIPSASKKLSISQDSLRGRYLTAACDIAPSEVLIHEHPFAVWMKSSANEDYCIHCMKSISGKHFIPCASCSVRFCGRECYDVATDQYHWLECKFMDVLCIVSSGHLAIRMILREGIERSLELFTEWVKRTSSSSSSPLPTSGKAYKIDYESVLNLVDHLNERSAEDKTAFAVASLFTAKLVNSILNFDTNPLAAVILKHVMQISCNVIAIESDPQEVEEGSCHALSSPSLTLIGVGVYPTISLMNHSCDRRTYRIITSGKDLTIKSYDCIKAGSEITLNYGTLDRKTSVKDRRDYLRRAYFFDCNCDSCNCQVENIGSAYACPVCPDGPVVVNMSDRSSYCVKCNRGNILDIDAIEEKVAQMTPQLQVIWEDMMSVMEEGNSNSMQEIELALVSLIKTYSKYLHSKSYRTIELKERLAFVYEQEKRVREAMKLWLDCYYATRQLEGEDSYDCLFFLLKITSGLIQESDELVEKKDFDSVKSNMDKISKYFKRGVMVSKKLKGREGKLLEAREEVLHSLPDIHSLSNDIKNLMTLCHML